MREGARDVLSYHPDPNNASQMQEICQLASGGGQELVVPLPPTLPLLFAGLTTLQFASNGPVCGSVVRFGAALPLY